MVGMGRSEVGDGPFEINTQPSNTNNSSMTTRNILMALSEGERLLSIALVPVYACPSAHRA
jgi:hypothetical protein